jgi:citrate lyase subunit beta/citryl-CoA lyase
MEPSAEALQAPNQLIIIAARAAGILPLGFMGTVADYKDLDAFRATIRRSRRFGFLGGACIHPGQVPILNEEYGPQADEVARAERLIAAYDTALARGAGAVEFEGKMIDVPVVERARRVLEQAARFRDKR